MKLKKNNEDESDLPRKESSSASEGSLKLKYNFKKGKLKDKLKKEKKLKQRKNWNKKEKLKKRNVQYIILSNFTTENYITIPVCMINAAGVQYFFCIQPR